MVSINLHKIFSLLVVFGLLAGAGCTTPADSDEDGDGDNSEPTMYELTVNVNPPSGGSVDPGSGSYEDSTEVELTASPEEGWIFTGWSGDISSQDNPLVVTMTGNTELTANFSEQAKAYSNTVEISDGINSETLTFGMKADASAGYDRGIDKEAPPKPPSGSFYANFVIEGYNLFDDYRPVTAEGTNWEIHFGTGEDNAIILKWDFSTSEHYGTLTLVDQIENPSVEIDMSSQSSYEVTDTTTTVLYILQQ